MSKILCRPPSAAITLPTGSIGKITYEALKGHNSHATALIDLKSGQDYSFGQLVDYSLTLAANLDELGIEQDDIIAIISENTHKFYVAALAGLYLASPIHLINPGYTKYELVQILNLSKPKLIFCTQKSYANVIQAKQTLNYIKMIIIMDDDEFNNNPADGNLIFYKNLIQPSKRFEIRDGFDNSKQLAIILNSSGTTGLPKGVMYSHENFLLNYLYAIDPEIYEKQLNETMLLIMPFFHMYGFGILCTGLYLGAKVLTMDQFNPVQFLESIPKYQVTQLFIVPSLANFLAKSPLTNSYDLSSVTEIYSAAAPPSEEIFKILLEKFKVRVIRQIYGLTELVAGVCLTPKQTTKQGSCGKLNPGRKLKIIDLKSGEILSVNQPGEICVAGGLMLGYINDPLKTQECIDTENFLHTGDVGYYDEDGFIFIVDRLKDLIKYKSFQVPPAEIEDLLLTHPAIKDAAVIGKPDDRVGELPVAFVVCKEEKGIGGDEEEICKFIAERLSVEKRLHGGVRFVKALPRNQLGKVLRKELREML